RPCFVQRAIVPPAPPSASSGCGVTTRTGVICSISNPLLSVSTRQLNSQFLQRQGAPHPLPHHLTALRQPASERLFSAQATPQRRRVCPARAPPACQRNRGSCHRNSYTSWAPRHP